MNVKHAPNYRPEIDGLRALAVIAVIINHFNKDFLPSGYLGVDIFFVISGYVITSSLIKNNEKNFFVFLKSFFTKRIKRLIPALVFFVLVTSLVISLFNYDVGLPLWTGLTSLFGLSNIYLYMQSTDYFAQASELNVFTHTWSLGVEEQFYFIFPFLLFFSGFTKEKTKGIKNLFKIIVIIGFISLFLFIYLYLTNQSAAYFLMPSRFWEIASGCLLFLSQKNNPLKLRRYSNIYTSITIVLILTLFFTPNSYGIVNTPIIVILTLFLIQNLKKGNLFYKFFTKNFVIYLGRISYSLYLWHWGILSISRWTIGISIWTIPLQIFLILLISNFSYRYIETPFRKIGSQKHNNQIIFKGFLTLIVSSSFLIILGKPLKGDLYLGKKENNFKELASNEFFKIDKDYCTVDTNKTYSNEKIFKKCLIKNYKNERKIFLLGDSHTLALYSGLDLIANISKANILLFNANETVFPSLNKRNFRSKIFKSFGNYIISKSKRGDILIINIRMPSKFIENWYETDKKYKNDLDDWLLALDKFSKKASLNGLNIVISNPTPEFPIAKYKNCKGQDTQWFNQLSKKECSYPIDYFDSEKGKYKSLLNKLNKLSQGNKNLFIFDALNAMCKNKICNYIENSKVLYRDDDHISNYSARNIIAPNLLEFLKENNLILNN